jgi:pimeloyl-ACP methyl ester carboxylesterase
MDEWCADLVRLLDAEGAQRAVLGGHCLGANIAMHFAARHPQRTAGLILIEPMPPDALVGGMRFLRRIRFLISFLASVFRLLNACGIRRRSVAPMDLEEWDKAVASGGRSVASFAGPLGDLSTTPTAAYLQSLAGVLRALPAPHQISCPALVLLSNGSLLADPARTRAAMERLNQVEIVELPALHWIPTEQPEAMRATIERWLAS